MEHTRAARKDSCLSVLVSHFRSFLEHAGVATGVPLHFSFTGVPLHLCSKEMPCISVPKRCKAICRGPADKCGNCQSCAKKHESNQYLASLVSKIGHVRRLSDWLRCDPTISTSHWVKVKQHTASSNCFCSCRLVLSNKTNSSMRNSTYKKCMRPYCWHMPTHMTVLENSAVLRWVCIAQAPSPSNKPPWSSKILGSSP